MMIAVESRRAACSPTIGLNKCGPKYDGTATV
jgi:hypothetical protein